MKVCHLSTFDLTGGAAKAMTRLHSGLREAGIDSHIYCSVKSSNDPHTHALKWRNTLPARLARKLFTYRHPEPQPKAPNLFFSQPRSWTGAQAWEQISSCDVLHIHWASALPEHYIPAPLDWPATIAALPRNLPVLVTLHDMNAFTGGCHYTVDCERFKIGCGQCPQLASPSPSDQSTQIWRTRLKVYQKLNTRLSIHATSSYIKRMAEQSPLLSGISTSLVPLGVDTEIYQPRERNPLRDKYTIPSDALVLLFVSDSLSNPLKGMNILSEALGLLKLPDNLLLLSVGRDVPTLTSNTPCRHLGHISNEPELAETYALSDIFIFPSRQETFGQTPLEAMASGCALAACPAGAIPDIVTHGRDGLIADSATPEALASCLEKLIHDAPLRSNLGQNARTRVEQAYSLDHSTRGMIDLYQSICPS